MPKRLTYEEVFESVNKISNGKTKLISNEYINACTPLLFQCQCGNTFSRRFDKFKLGRILCDACTTELQKETKRLDFNYVKSEIEKTGCKYISGKYENDDSKLYLQCRCGNYFYKSWGKFHSGQDRCKDCGNELVKKSKRKYYPENAKEILKEYGYTMIGNFIDGATKVECICSKGHKCNIALSQLIYERHSGCLQCAQENRKGDKHPNYKGGISMLDDDIRKSLFNWKNNIREIYNHQCPITHKNKLDTIVHHLYSLSSIYNDVINELNLDVKLHDTIENNDLSEKDKQLIISKVVEKHTNKTGILIDKDIHIAFHKQYGYGENTPEQFDRFLRDNYSLTLNQIMKI